MIEIVLLILLLVPARPDKPIVTCTVVSRNVVTCATRNPALECANSKHKLCRSVTLDIPDGFWDDVFSEWAWKTEDHPSHWNFPLIKQRLSVGAKLKATLDENGQIVPLASCDVRIWRQVNRRAASNPGEPPSLTVMEPPKDCGGGR